MMKKVYVAIVVLTGIMGVASQADVVLRTDFTGFATGGTTISNVTWSSELGEEAHATTNLTLTGSATGFKNVTPGVGGTGPAVGVAGNIETVGSWSTSFTFTPSQSLDITQFEISSYSISGRGTHQDADHVINWALEITSSGTDFSGNTTETELGVDLDKPQSFSINTSGTTLNAGTTYTFNLTVSSPSTAGNNIALDTLTLKTLGSAVPSIVDFSASHTNVLIGETITLSWDVEDATSLSLNQGIGNVLGTSSTQVVVNADSTYTLTALNINGSTNASVQVVLTTTPPVIHFFTASSSSVAAGETVTLSWDVEDAASLSLNQGIGDVSGISSTQVVVNADSTYTLTALNANGSVEASVDLTVVEFEQVLSTDFTGFSTAISPSIISGFSWSSDIGEAANATPTLELTNHAENAFLDIAAGTGGTGPAVGVKENLVTKGPWGTAFTFTPSQTIEISSFEISTYAITGSSPAAHQADPRTLNWALAIISTETNFTGNITKIDPGGDAPVLMAIDTTGTTLTADTAYTFNLTVSTPLGVGVNVALDTFVLKAIVSAADPVEDLIISGPVDAGTKMVLSWTGEAGGTYSVETNANLIGSNWQPFTNGMNGIDGTLSVTNTIEADQTFYRVIIE